MIRRIAFIVAALVILAATHPVTAQQTKPARIGTLLSGSQVSQGHRLDWFRQGLRYLGYVEGRNYVFVSRWAMGKGERMPKLAAELVPLWRRRRRKLPERRTWRHPEGDQGGAVGPRQASYRRASQAYRKGPEALRQEC